MKEDKAKIICHDTWKDFINLPQREDSIFRGHANFKIDVFKPSFKTENFEEWKVESTWHRQNKNEFWSQASRFSLFVDSASQYQEHLKDFIKKDDIEDCSLLNYLHYFQHYGIPTPLIDFTFNKDVAMYFAFAGIGDVPPFERVGNIPDLYVTIVEIRTSELVKDGLLKVVNDELFNAWDKLYSDDFFLYEPENTRGNKNIELQEGLFIYLDSDQGIEDFVDRQYDKITNDIAETRRRCEASIIKHQIPYYSLFNSCESDSSLFPYLLKRKKLGRDLFNDIKGIQFDMNNPDISLACIQKPDECACLKKIEVRK